MRSRRAALAAILAVMVGLPALAGDEVTLKGNIVCAKCTLKKADAKECQNVLLAPGADGKDVEYYLAKSEAADAVGEVCTGKKPATITGTVTEKDGRKWLTASKVESKS